MKLKPLIFVLLVTVPCVSQASEKVVNFEATSVRVVNESAIMRYHKDYFITVVSGSVGSEGIPEIISLGDLIRVKDRTIRVNHIYGTKCLQTLEWAGEVFCQKNNISCVIVERPEDRPSDEERDRLWIHVQNCEPLQ